MSNQTYRKSFGVVRFHLGPLLQGQTKIAKCKGAYKLLNISLRVFGCETDL